MGYVSQIWVTQGSNSQNMLEIDKEISHSLGPLGPFCFLVQLRWIHMQI